MYMPSRERTLRYPELQEVSAACYNILRKYYKTIFQQETIMKKDELRYLQRLAELYPTIGRASTEMICNLQSILNLPKGTEPEASSIAPSRALQLACRTRADFWFVFCQIEVVHTFHVGSSWRVRGIFSCSQERLRRCAKKNRRCIRPYLKQS